MELQHAERCSALGHFDPLISRDILEHLCLVRGWPIDLQTRHFGSLADVLTKRVGSETGTTSDVSVNRSLRLLVLDSDFDSRANARWREFLRLATTMHESVEIVADLNLGSRLSG